MFRLCCGDGEEVDRTKEAVDDIGDEGAYNNLSARESQLNLHAKQRRARKTVFACSVEVTEGWEPPVHLKDKASKAFIDESLGGNFIFDTVEPAERQQLIDAMVMERVEESTHIIDQGDSGDFFYIVQDGQVNFVADGQNVGSCKKGGSFGELALLYNSPRAATCIAASDCKLWKLDQRTFRTVLVNRARNEQQDLAGILDKVPLLSQLDSSMKRKLADALIVTKFPEGTRIVNKGDEGNIFYIVKEGTVRVHDIGLGHSEFVDQILTSGGWFGERALLTGEPRAANVTAVSDVVALALTRDNFQCTFGSLQLLMDLEAKKEILRGVPIFANSSFENHEFSQLAEVANEMCYKAGETLVKRGEINTQELFVIVKGRLLVADKNGQLVKLVQGDYYGADCVKLEHGVICNEEVTVDDNTTCWVLTKESIVSVIGDIRRLGEPIPYVASSMNSKIKFKELKKHRVLGMGAFGKVWLVTHRKTNRPYALKTMDKRQLIKSNQAKGVLREKNVMASIEHPFILNMVSSFQDPNYLYLLMELVQGGELFDVIHSKKTDGLSEGSARFYGACIAEALSYMHKRSIAYRDLKPENVLIDASGYCVVVDMGFAKIVVDKTYTLCGTPEYLAPEIIMSKGHDHGVDWWAFGILLYEMLVGKSPFFFHGIDQVSMFKRIVLVKYTCPSTVPSTAQDFIRRVLVRKTTDRMGKLAGGSSDIKNHPFFESVDFKDLVKRKPQAPWVPTIKDPLDSSHFGNFHQAERPDTFSFSLSPDEQALFKDF